MIKVIEGYMEIYNFLLTAKFDNDTREFLSEHGEIFDLSKTLYEADLKFSALYSRSSLFMYVEDKTGMPMGFMGVIPLFKGVVEWYSYSDKDLSAYAFAKTAKWYINYLRDITLIKRIQATVLVKNKNAYNLHKKLGFVEEGIMRKYDGKNDYYMMAVVL